MTVCCKKLKNHVGLEYLIVYTLNNISSGQKIKNFRGFFRIFRDYHYQEGRKVFPKNILAPGGELGQEELQGIVYKPFGPLVFWTSGMYKQKTVEYN